MRRLDNIDIRLLRIFVTLADCGGFADAQITLNLSQPTLSTHLAELEKRIGAQLCHRGRKQFRLTEVGQATYDAAQKLFRDLDDFGHRISAASGAKRDRRALPSISTAGLAKIATATNVMPHSPISDAVCASASGSVSA